MSSEAPPLTVEGRADEATDSSICLVMRHTERVRGASMPNIERILRDHTTLQVECLDRLYFCSYVSAVPP